MKPSTLVIAILLLQACASTPSTPSEYLLSGPSESSSRQHHGTVDAALARVAVAEYLNRPEIVVETRDGVIQPAFAHRWAEPLEAGLRRAIARVASDASGLVVLPDATAAAPLLVDVTIERFHGTESGRVTLAARWTVRRDDGISHHRMVDSVLTRADGYAALVDAHDALVDTLAQGIGQTLKSPVGP